MNTTIAETYNDVQKLIRSVCNRFSVNRGGDFDDLLSEANYCYLTVYESFDESKCKFSTWLYRKIWWHLLEWERTNRRKQYRRREYVLSSDFDLPLPEQFDIEQLCNELSEDAAHVIRLALEKKEMDSTSYTNESKRRIIGETLADMGWAGGRILKAFRELTEVLS